MRPPSGRVSNRCVDACWSTPIVATDGRVLGTFALYYREPHAPTVQDQHVIDVATDIAGIAIARQRADDEHAQLLREQGARAEAEALRARFEEVFRRAPALIGLVQGPKVVMEPDLPQRSRWRA